MSLFILTIQTGPSVELTTTKAFTEGTYRNRLYVPFTPRPGTTVFVNAGGTRIHVHVPVFQSPAGSVNSANVSSFIHRTIKTRPGDPLTEAPHETQRRVRSKLVPAEMGRRPPVCRLRGTWRTARRRPAGTPSALDALRMWRVDSACSRKLIDTLLPRVADGERSRDEDGPVDLYHGPSGVSAIDRPSNGSRGSC